MDFWAGIIILSLLITNIVTGIGLLEMRKSRDDWYKNSVMFSDKLQKQQNELNQKWEDILDENRV